MMNQWNLREAAWQAVVRRTSWLALLGGLVIGGGCATPAAVGDDLLAGGQVERALTHLEAQARSYPEDVDVHAVLGAAYRRAGRPAEAEAQLRQALNLNPDHLRARQELLALLLEQERFILAVVAADELRRVVPADPAVAPPQLAALLRRAGQQAFDSHQVQQAITLFERLVALDPERRAEVNVLLGRSYDAQVLLLLEEDRPDDALRALELALERGGPNPARLARRGELLLALHRPDEAERSFEQLLELAPVRTEAARQAGAALRKANESEAALRFYAKAVEATPTPLPQDLLTLGTLYLELGRVPQAREVLERYVTLRQGTPEALLEVARLAEEKNQGELARQFWSRAVQLAPQDFSRLEGLCNLLVQQGRRDEAVRLIEHYQAQGPSAEAHFHVAQWFRTQGELNRAVGAYQQALRATPRREVIHLRLAELFRELRRAPERQQALDRFVQGSTDKVTAQLKVAEIYKESGDFPEALRHLEAATRQAPGEPRIWLARAGVFEAAKQPEREAEAWRGFIQASREPDTAVDEVIERYLSRGDLERALQFVELGLRSARDEVIRRELFLTRLDLYRRLDDAEGMRTALQQLIMQESGVGEKRMALREALRTLAEASVPQLKLQLLEALLALPPIQPEILLQLGQLHLELRSWATATATLERYVELSTNKVEALSQLAQAYTKAQRQDLAVATLNRMLQLGASDPATLLAAIELRLEQNGPTDEEALRLLDRFLELAPPPELDLPPLARKLEDWRLFAAAEKVFRYADARQPLATRDLKRLGRVLLQQRKPADAAAIIARLEQQSKATALARTRIEWGQVCSEVGLPEEALKYFGAVLRQGEGPLHQAFQLAVDAVQQLGDPTQLEPLAGQYAARATPPEEVHAAIARGWLTLGDETRTLQSWRRVLVYDPRSQEALQQIASMLLRRGEADAAGVLIEQQIKDAGDQPEAWLGLARRFRRFNEYRQAIRYYEVALQRGGDPAVIQLERGLSLLALGDRTAGREAIDRALTATRGDALDQAIRQAGQQYVAIGWEEAAIETFRRGLTLEKTNADYYGILAELFLRGGRVDLARRIVAEARTNGMNRLLLVALAFEEAGYQQQANGLYQQIVEQGVEGQVIPAFFRLGLDLVDRGLAARLGPLAQRFLAAVNYSFEGHWLVALLHTRAGRHEDALQHLLAGQDQDEAERSWNLVVEAALRAGRPGVALDTLLQRVASSRSATSDAKEAIDLLLMRGQLELAQTLLSRLGGGVLSPAYQQLLQGWLLLRQGKLHAGATLLNRALASSREGEKAKIRQEATGFLAEVRLFAEAEELLRAEQGVPSKESQLTLLQLRIEQGRTDGIEPVLEAYLTTPPIEPVEDRIMAGALLRGSGRFEQAVTLLRRALELSTGDEERRQALYHLFACLHALGRDDEAAQVARQTIGSSGAPIRATHQVVGELKKLNRWELIGELLRTRRQLARRDARLLQDELDARLALGQEQQLEPMLEDFLQYAFTAEQDERTRTEIIGRVANRLFQTQRTHEAIRRWEQVLTITPAEFAPLEKMITASLEAGDVPLQEQLLLRFFQAAGERPATWRWAAKKLLGQGEGRRALPHAERLLAATPQDPQSHLTLVAAALLAGDDARARTATEAALRATDDPPRSRVMLATLWLTGGHPFPDVEEEGLWLRTGSASRLRQVTELVEPVCREGGEGYALGWLLRGLARLQLRDPGAAQADLDRFLQQGGGYSAMRLQPFPTTVDRNPELSRLADLLNEETGSVADLAGRLLVIIDAYAAAGEDARAWPLIEQLAARAPNPEEQLGRVLQRASLHRRAKLGLRVLEFTSRRFPDNAWEVTMLADLLEQGGDLPAAVEAYRRAIAQEPYQPVFYNNLAYFHARAGQQLAEAERLVRQARRFGPQGEKFYMDTEGWVLYQQGRYAQAEQLIRGSIWLMDRAQGAAVAESYYHLGMVQQKLGKRDEARAAFLRAAAADLFGNYGDWSRQELERMK